MNLTYVNQKRLSIPNGLSTLKNVLINDQLDSLPIDELSPDRFNQIVKVMEYNEQVTLETIRKWVTTDTDELDTVNVESDSDDEDTVVNEDVVSDEEQLLESVTDDDESICDNYHYINQYYGNKLVNSKEAA